MNRFLMSCAALAFAASSAAAQAPALDQRIEALAKAWDHVNFETQGAAKADGSAALAIQAETLAQQFPGRAEPLLWKGIALSTEAGAKGGLGALKLAKEAKSAFEQAEKLGAPSDGSVYTSLGSLYYQVPGFPVGFGDKAKAETYLKKGLAANPSGLDANYFYADFLLRQGRADEAQRLLQKALAAPPRPGREVQEKGRRAEINALMAQARTKRS